MQSRQNLETQFSYYSDTSSIARFPEFQFSLGALSALASANGKVCLLLAVLEVDGPDDVTVRRGPDTGHVISVLRLILATKRAQYASSPHGGKSQRHGVARHKQ